LQSNTEAVYTKPAYNILFLKSPDNSSSKISALIGTFIQNVRATPLSVMTKQTIHLTLITTFGLTSGKHSGKIQTVVTFDDLFK